MGNVTTNTLIDIGFPMLLALIGAALQQFQKSQNVIEIYNKLLVEISNQKSLTLIDFLNNWDRTDTRSEGIPSQYYDFWNRLAEIQEKETPIRLIYFTLKKVRGLSYVLIVLGFAAIVIALLAPESQSWTIPMTYTFGLLSFLLSIITFILAEKVKSFNELALFQRNTR